MPTWTKSGWFWIVLGTFCFSLMGGLAKYACASLGSMQVVFFRALFALPVLLLIHALHGEKRPPLLGCARGSLVLRGIIGAVGVNLYFFALSGLPVVDAMLLNQISPLFVLPLGIWLLHEPVAPRQWLMVPVALAGVALVLQPQFDMLNLAGLAALGSAVSSALAYLTVRKLAGTDSAHTIVLYFSIFSILASLPFLLIEPQWPDPMTWLALAGVGVLSVGGQMGMTLALHHDTAGRVSMFGNLGVVFAVVWDLLFFSLVPGAFTVVGAVLIVAALFEINRLGKLRPLPRPS